MKNDAVMVGAAVVYKRVKGKEPQWFIVKSDEGGEWEIPKTIVRRGESSVRSVIRLTQEQASMRTKVLEEVGRASGAGRVNGKAVNQKYLYYLLHCKDTGEIMAFPDFKWVDYKVAAKLLPLKRDQNMLKDAKEILKTVDVKREKLQDEIDAEALEAQQAK